MTELGTVLLSFWSHVLTHLWQSSLVILPLFLLARGLQQAPARLGDRFWSMALLKICLPLAVGGVLMKNLLDGLSGWLVSDVAVATGGVATVVTAVLDPEPGWDWQGISARPWITVGLVCFTVLWQAIVIWRVTLAIRDITRINRFRRLSVADLPVVLRRRLERVLVRTDIPASPVAITETATMPAVFGMLRPQILIPQQLIASLPENEMAAILKHEDAHRRRHDPLRFLLLRLCQAVFFFYPLIHPIARRLREGAEYACDEAALTTGIDPGGYARALARAVNLNLAPAPLAVAAGTGGPSLLKKRLSRLHQPERSVMSRYRLILIAAVLLVCAGSFLPLSSTAVTPPPPPAPVEANESEAPPAPPATPAAPATSAAPVAEPGDAIDQPSPPSPPSAPRADSADDPPPPPPKKGEKADAKEGAKATEAERVKVKSEGEASEEQIEGNTADGESLVTRPKIVHLEQPEYPDSARKAKADGRVVIKVLVDEKGKVVKAKVEQGVEGYPELDKAALKAAKACTFEPGTKDGEPVQVWAFIPFEFKLK